MAPLADNETSTLLPTTSHAQEEAPRTSIAKRAAAGLFAVGVVLSLGVAAVSYNTSSSTPTSSLLDSLERPQKLDTSTDHGWYIYKLAFVGAAQQRNEIWHFLDTFIYGSEEATGVYSLGCDGYKLNVQLDGAQDMSDRQLHYVTAPNLPSVATGGTLDANGWIKLQMQDMSDMSTFTAFVHDKATLYVSDVVSRAAELAAGGYSNMMQRQSTSDDGYLVGHVLVPVGGKVWEFVGTLDMTSDEAATAGYTEWADDECPMAHAVNGVAALETAVATATSDLFITLSNAVSSTTSDDFVFLLSQLSFTSPDVVETANANCNLVSLTWSNGDQAATGGIGGQAVELRYVQNLEHNTMKTGESVEDFQEAIWATHEEFLKPHIDDVDVRWRNWDHWLDFHVGLKYKSSTGCLDEAIDLTEMLTTNHVPVGKRMVASDGDHYYAGFRGSSMCVEFNTECHYGTGTSDICACSGMNSYFLSSAENIVDANCDIIHEIDTEASGRTDDE